MHWESSLQCTAVGHMQCNAGETAAVLVGNVSDSVSSPSASSPPSASAQIERHSPVSYSCARCAVQTVQPVESVAQLQQCNVVVFCNCCAACSECCPQCNVAVFCSCYSIDAAILVLCRLLGVLPSPAPSAIFIVLHTVQYCSVLQTLDRHWWQQQQISIEQTLTG